MCPGVAQVNFDVNECKPLDKGKKASECQDDDLMTGVGALALLWPKVGRCMLNR
jgi:hypothetical protein